MQENTDEIHLTKFKGSSWSEQLVFTDDDNEAVDISDWVFYFTLRTQPDSTDTSDANAVLKKTFVAEDPTHGIATMTLTASETSTFLNTYYFDFRYKDNNDVIETIVQGRVTFLDPITHRVNS
jgi:hypothetical protein